MRDENTGKLSLAFGYLSWGATNPTGLRREENNGFTAEGKPSRKT